MAENLVAVFFVTTGVEIAVAYLLGYRGARALLAIAAVNLVTGPLAWWLFLRGEAGAFLAANPALQFARLALNIAAEWLLLSFFLKNPRRKLLPLSFLMNAVSFLVWALLF